MFVLFAELSFWNAYLLAESIYVSFVCFSILIATELSVARKNRLAQVIIAFLILTFTTFIKPTGISVAAALAITGLAWLWKTQRRPIAVLVTVVVAMALTFFANRMLYTYQVMENYQSGEIIYAITTVSDTKLTDQLTVEVPPSLTIPEASLPPVIRILKFAIDHPVYWLKLFTAKVFYLLTHIRPYWSWYHNLFSAAFLLISYVFFFRGLLSSRRYFFFKTALLTFLTVQILSVGMTSEDWDGRFLMPMLPVIFLFAGRGIGLLLFPNRPEVVHKAP